MGVAALTAADDSIALAGGGSTPRLSLTVNGITVAVAPELGGKVISLIGPDGVDRLSRSTRAYRPRTMDMPYGDSEFDGLDEIFPTLATVPAGPETPAIPDHGDAWRLPWHTIDGPGLTLSVDGKVLPYRLTRSITIEQETVTFSYRLVNIGDKDLPWTYCFHPLFTLGTGVELEIAAQDTVRVMSSGGDFLGDGATNYPWKDLLDGPLAGHTAVPGRGRFWKAILVAPQQRSVRLRWRDGAAITMAWTGEHLRHAGIWSTEGAILDGLQHIAIEPSNAVEDRLDQAISAGTAAKLSPGSSATWTVSITWDQQK